MKEWEKEMVIDLYGKGYSHEEIHGIVEATLDEINDVINHHNRHYPLTKRP